MPEKVSIERMNDGIREAGEIEVSSDGLTVTLMNVDSGEHDGSGPIADHWIDVPLPELLEAIGRSIRS